MNAGGDGVLFGRQTKTVVSKSVKNVVSLHALEARKHVGADVPEWVSHVQARTRGVWEHVENECLWAIADGYGIFQRPCGVWRMEGSLCIPGVLPA